MASVKAKFRPSSIDGKEGSIYYQVIHNRVVRHIRTDYRIFESEWNGKLSMIDIPTMLSGRKEASPSVDCPASEPGCGEVGIRYQRVVL